MSEVLDRSGLAAGLEAAGIAWKELGDAERARYAVDGVAPKAICWPASSPEVAAALAVADRLGLAVSPRGSGTKVSLGNPPRAVDLIVSTEKLNRVVEYAPANLTLTVEAGARLAEINAVLAPHRQFLPINPSFVERATLGGILAANANGPLRLGYGSVRDLVIGTRAATTSGTVVKAGGRVVKNVAGYDLNKLYVGSLGTLVVLTEVSFKLAPLPEAQTTVLGRFARLDALGEALRQIVRSPLMPTALDFLNGPAVAALSLSELRNRASEADGAYILAARGAAPGGGVGRQREGIIRILQTAGAQEIVDLDDDRSARFWERVVERPVQSTEPNGVRARVSVPIGEGAGTVATIEARPLGGFHPAIGGAAGSGVYFVTWNLPAPTSAALGEEVARGLADLRDAIRTRGGSLVIEAAPAEVKAAVDVWGDVGASLVLMKRLKAALDPNSTLNPGRFVGGI